MAVSETVVHDVELFQLIKHLKVTTTTLSLASKSVPRTCWLFNQLATAYVLSQQRWGGNIISPKHKNKNKKKCLVRNLLRLRFFFIFYNFRVTWIFLYLWDFVTQAFCRTMGRNIAIECLRNLNFSLNRVFVSRGSTVLPLLWQRIMCTCWAKCWAQKGQKIKCWQCERIIAEKNQWLAVIPATCCDMISSLSPFVFSVEAHTKPIFCTMTSLNPWQKTTTLIWTYKTTYIAELYAQLMDRPAAWAEMKGDKISLHSYSGFEGLFDIVFLFYHFTFSYIHLCNT